MIACSHEGMRITSLNGGSTAAAIAPRLIDEMPDICLTVGVPTGDGGGSTQDFRKLAKGAAVGDSRQALSAVSGNDAGELFERRFDAADTTRSLAASNNDFKRVLKARGMGDDALAQEVLELTAELGDQIWELEGKKTLDGHAYGNFILTALQRACGGNLIMAVEQAGSWLEARAHVVPVTNESHNLVLFDGHEKRIDYGEGVIDARTLYDSSESEVWLECGAVSNYTVTDPEKVAAIRRARLDKRRPHASPEIIDALVHSDIINVGPASFVTSLLDIVLAKGVPEAFMQQEANGGHRVLVQNNGGEKRMPDLTLDRCLQWLEHQGLPLSHVLYDDSRLGALAERITIDGNGGLRIGAAVAIGVSLVDAGATIVHRPNDRIGHLRNDNPPTNVHEVANVFRGLTAVPATV